MDEPFLYLASPCYGGLAQAGYMRSVLALRAALAARAIILQLDLGGGEALISRARASMLARFLGTAATHLLFIDGDQAFDTDEVLGLFDAAAPVVAVGGNGLLIRREAAQEVVDAHPELQANLGDLRNSGAARAPMVFESSLDLSSGAYFTDLAAFTRRWQDLAGRKRVEP
jgi:hypothetical protein